MVGLQEILAPEENVIDQFVGIRYQDESYNVAITNLNVVLYREKEQESIKINYDSIEFISFQKEWYIDLVYFAIISFCLGFICLFVSLIVNLPLNLPPPQVWPPSNSDLLRSFFYPGIAFAMLGISAVILYFIRVKFSLLISGPKGNFELFSNHEMLLKLNGIIKNIKLGNKESLKQEKILRFPDYLRTISNLIIGISILFLAIITWVLNSPTLLSLFYIPFFLLIIGFIMALLSYNEEKVKKNYFKLGILLIFLGMNFIWIQIYYQIWFLVIIISVPIYIPIIGLLILLIGAILFFDSYSIE